MSEVLVLVLVFCLFLAPGLVAMAIDKLGERVPAFEVNNLRLWLLVAYLWRWRR